MKLSELSCEVMERIHTGTCCQAMVAYTEFKNCPSLNRQNFRDAVLLS